jgi:signal transduction histidine kinase
MRVNLFKSWLCLCLCILLAPRLWAQALEEQKIIASYLYNFAKNVDWPQMRSLRSFDIALYGEADPVLLAAMDGLQEKGKIHGLPVTYRQVNSVAELPAFQMVYLERADKKIITDIYDALDGKPVLLVTRDSNNQQLVMINLISEGRSRLKFEVNKSNIINQGLKVQPELILSGGTEIDVARLYREGQASLVALQKQLRNQEAASKELNESINKQQAINRSLQQQMAELANNIDASDALIAKQKEQLQQQQQHIDQSRQEREALMLEVQSRTSELANQQSYLTKILSEIDAREKRLAYLNSTIGSLEDTILEQKNAISGLDQVVDSQQIALRYLWGSVVLGALLIITILIAYIVKRRDNRRLATRSQDLQLAQERLAIAKRKAEDASQAKGEFLSLMSHELRTPLQSIIGYTEVVIEELKLVNDDAHINDLQRVINNSERLLKLINGVLDLAKIEAGGMELDLTQTKLSRLVDEALGAVVPLLEKNAIRLRVDVDDGESLPVADPEKLLHILINLLGNAIKFAPCGEVEVQAYHRPDLIFISVADTGIGISQEQQGNIFYPFRQADSSTTRKYQGSGLGLSISRQLCEIMGGTIRVESELGKGARFIVELPLPIKPAAAVTHKEQ